MNFLWLKFYFTNFISHSIEIQQIHWHDITTLIKAPTKTYKYVFIVSVKFKSSCVRRSAPLTRVPGSALSCCARSVLPGSSALLPLPPFNLSHPDSQLRVSLALLKLPLGNVTPYMKPEIPEVTTHKRTHAQTKTNTHTHTKETHCFECGGHLALFSLLSPLHGISEEDKGSSPEGANHCLTWWGESGTLSFPTFLQSKHPHAGSSNPASPWGLYCILPLIQHLSQLHNTCSSIHLPRGFSPVWFISLAIPVFYETVTKVFQLLPEI